MPCRSGLGKVVSAKGDGKGCEVRTSEIGDPVRMRVAGEDDGVGDVVLLEVVENARAVGAVAVPGVEIDYRMLQRLKFPGNHRAIHTRARFV